MTEATTTTKKLSAGRGFPAFVIGCLTLADLAAGRLLLRADQAHVYLAGRALPFHCAFFDATGLPCPTCGMTRSVVMTLHGEWAQAWRMAPGGPVLVAGLALFALAAIAIGLRQPRSTRLIRRSAFVYAAAAAAIWLGGWLAALHAALTRYQSLQ